MPNTAFVDLLTYINTLSGEPRCDLTDGQLMERFVSNREETAFALLVQRHGPLVLGVCQRVLGDTHAVEDAFQATFLVLARRAAAIRKRASVGSWLHRVAQRVSHRARSQQNAQRILERRASVMPQTNAIDEASWEELRAVLDEEIATLPEKYGTSLVLCHLQEKSYSAAAKELGCSKSTLARRVALARELLRQRLIRRGITLSAGAVATALCPKASAAPITALLTISTVKAAMCFTAGKAAAAGRISASARGLAEHALEETAGIRAKMAILTLLCTLVLGGAGWAVYGMLTASLPDAEPNAMTTPSDMAALPDDKTTEAENLFRSMEKKVQAAKSLKAVYEVELAHGGGKVIKLKVRQFLGEGNKLRLEWDEQDGGTGKNKLLVSNGRQTLLSELGAKEQGSPPTPGKLNSHFGGLLARGGGFFTAVLAEVVITKFNDTDDLGKLLQFRDFKWGDKVQLGMRDAQIIDCAFTFELQGEKHPGNVTLYIDVKTLLPLKRVTKLEANEVATEVFTEFEIDCQLDAKLFELPAPIVPQVQPDPSKSGVQALQGSIFAKDLYGDPLPPGALMRLGTERFHQGTLVRAVAFSPNGKLLASGGWDGDGLCLWDADTGRALLRLRSEYGGWGCLAFSPDGKTLCTGGGFNHELELIDVDTGKVLRKFRRLDAANSSHDSVVFSPDGNTLASGEYLIPNQNTTVEQTHRMTKVVLWDAATANVVRVHNGQRKPCFSQDGKTLVTSGLDRLFHVWDVKSGKELKSFSGPSGEVYYWATYSAGAKLAAAVGSDSIIRLWDLQEAKLTKEFEPKEKGMRAIQLSPDGKLLAAAQGRTIFLFETKSFAEIRRWNTSHTRRIDSLTFSPDAKVLVSTGFMDGAIGRWQTATGKEIAPEVGHNLPVAKLQYAANGRALFSLGHDWNAIEWDPQTGRERRKLFTPAPEQIAEGKSAEPVDASKDARLLVLSTWQTEKLRRLDGLSVWDTAANKELCTLNAKGPPVSPRLSPDNMMLASGSPEGIMIWQIPSGKLLRLIPGFKGNQLAFSPDSAVLAWAEPDQTIHLWDIAKGTETRRWESGIKRTQFLQFSEDGKLLAGADFDKVHVWEIDSGREVIRVGEVGTFAISSSGRVIASWASKSLDKGQTKTLAIGLWEVDCGQLIRWIDIPVVSSLAFAPMAGPWRSALVPRFCFGTSPAAARSQTRRLPCSPRRSLTPCGPTSPTTRPRPTPPCGLLPDARSKVYRF
jgi:RNA polymerase sigma factor (sigma-70 family)